MKQLSVFRIVTNVGVAICIVQVISSIMSALLGLSSLQSLIISLVIGFVGGFLFNSFVANIGMKTRSDAKEKYSNLSIVEIMLLKRQDRAEISYAVLFIALALTVIFNMGNLVFLIVFAVLLTVFIRQQIFEFRIRKGFYGKNAYEAKEIIHFASENYRDIDITGGGPHRKIFSDEYMKSLEEKVERLVSGKPQPA